jgi:hypothetical protein
VRAASGPILSISPGKPASNLYLDPELAVKIVHLFPSKDLEVLGLTQLQKTQGTELSHMKATTTRYQANSRKFFSDVTVTARLSCVKVRKNNNERIAKITG